MEHLPKNGDLELGLLKTHLLCEEVLTKAIERKLPSKEPFTKAKLTFSQKVQLGQCFYPADSTAWLWPALKKLNRARNELAHALARQEVQQQIEEFIKFVEQNSGLPSEDQLSEKFGRFHWAAFCVFAMLAGAAHYDPTRFKPLTILGSQPDAP